MKLVAYLISLLSFLGILLGNNEAPRQPIIAAEPLILVEWHPTEELLATVSHNPNTVRNSSLISIWDMDNGQVIQTIGEDRAPLSSIAWSPDGQLIAGLQLNYYLQVWDYATGQRINLLEIDRVITREQYYLMARSIDWNPESTKIVIGNDNSVDVWDIYSNEVLDKPLEIGVISGVAWSPNGNFIAAANKASELLILDTEFKIVTQFGPNPALYPSTSEHTSQYLEWSPDSRFIANFYARSEGFDNAFIFVHDVKTGEQVITLAFPGEIQAIAWSPDGGEMAAAIGDSFSSDVSGNVVVLWDIKTGELLETLTGHSDTVTSVTWNPTGDMLASVSYDGTIRIWDLSEQDSVD